MPDLKKEHRDGMALNWEEAPLDVDVKNGGRVVVLNTKNLPLVREVRLEADLVRLDGGAMCSSEFSEKGRVLLFSQIMALLSSSSTTQPTLIVGQNEHNDQTHKEIREYSAA